MRFFLILAIALFALSAKAQVLQGVEPGAWMTITEVPCTPLSSIEGGPKLQECPPALMVPFVDMDTCAAMLAEWVDEARKLGELYLRGMGVDTTTTAPPNHRASCA